MLNVGGMSREELKRHMFDCFGPLLFVNPRYGGKRSHILHPLHIPAFTGGSTNGPPYVKDLDWNPEQRGRAWLLSLCGGWGDYFEGTTKADFLFTNMPESRAAYSPSLPLCSHCATSYEHVTGRSISIALSNGEVLQKRLTQLIQSWVPTAFTAEEMMERMSAIEDEVILGKNSPPNNMALPSQPDPAPQEQAGMVYLDMDPGHKLEDILSPLALVYTPTEGRYIGFHSVGGVFKDALISQGAVLESCYGILAIRLDQGCILDLDALRRQFNCNFELHEVFMYYKPIDTERLRNRKLAKIRDILSEHFGPVTLHMEDERVVVQFKEW